MTDGSALHTTALSALPATRLTSYLYSATPRLAISHNTLGLLVTTSGACHQLARCGGPSSRSRRPGGRSTISTLTYEAQARAARHTSLWRSAASRIGSNHAASQQRGRGVGVGRGEARSAFARCRMVRAPCAALRWWPRRAALRLHMSAHAPPAGSRIAPACRAPLQRRRLEPQHGTATRASIIRRCGPRLLLCGKSAAGVLAHGEVQQ
jgi:hypothetical protein